VAANALGDLFVSDMVNDTVRHIDIATDDVTTSVGTPLTGGVALGRYRRRLAFPLESPSRIQEGFSSCPRIPCYSRIDHSGMWLCLLGSW